MTEGRFPKFLKENDTHIVAKSLLVDLFDEAARDFPEEPSFFDKLAAGSDIYLAYAGKVAAWREKWFGV